MKNKKGKIKKTKHQMKETKKKSMKAKTLPEIKKKKEKHCVNESEHAQLSCSNETDIWRPYWLRHGCHGRISASVTSQLRRSSFKSPVQSNVSLFSDRRTLRGSEPQQWECREKHSPGWAGTWAWGVVGFTGYSRQ